MRKEEFENNLASGVPTTITDDYRELFVLHSFMGGVLSIIS